MSLPHSLTLVHRARAGVRKHCRKSHPEWLREVDLDKANLGCRWAAYCTREAVTEAHDPRNTPVGSKRAREIMAQQGGALPALPGGIACALKATGAGASYGAESSRTASVSYEDIVEYKRPDPPPEPRRHVPSHLMAMDGKSQIVPLRNQMSQSERAKAAAENLMPPVRATPAECCKEGLR